MKDETIIQHIVVRLKLNSMDPYDPAMNSFVGRLLYHKVHKIVCFGIEMIKDTNEPMIITDKGNFFCSHLMIITGIA